MWCTFFEVKPIDKSRSSFDCNGHTCSRHHTNRNAQSSSPLAYDSSSGQSTLSSQSPTAGGMGLSVFSVGDARRSETMSRPSYDPQMPSMPSIGPVRSTYSNDFGTQHPHVDQFRSDRSIARGSPHLATSPSIHDRNERTGNEERIRVAMLVENVKSRYVRPQILDLMN